MRFLVLCAVVVVLLVGATTCRRTPDPAEECRMTAATPAYQPIGAYRIFVDGSRSMAPFLAPTNADGFVTAYEEMLNRLPGIEPQDSAETWLFGDTLEHLANTPETRQRLETRSTYQRGQSRLEFAFRHARAYLDSVAPVRGSSAAKPRRPGRAGVAIIVTDGLQSGNGRQLHILAEFDRMIRDHVANGGSFAFVAGMAGKYPARSRGTVHAEETKPVLVFLFGSDAVRDGLEALARELSAGLGARSEGGQARFFVLPVRGAANGRLRPHSGVRQVLSTTGNPPVFSFETGPDTVEILADAELGAATRANLPALSARIERCAGQAWEPAGDASGWSADPVRVDSAGNGVHLKLRRGNAAAVRGGLLRVRLEGNPVPPWIDRLGAGPAGNEDDLERFFDGLRGLAGTDAASFGTFYLRVRSD
jgi:hypothetical protein